MSGYETIIGLEVHVELNTQSKMFCSCSADYFGKEPNTLTCPVCLGLPGALPYINQVAIDKCIQIGLALNCSVNHKSRFERKNYFYPDLAKGFQISQLRWPLNINGWMDIDVNGQKKKIRINRVHQEEDTAKLTHQLGISNSQFPISNETRSRQGSYIDFNRSGVPLVEIVTEPDFRDPEEVREYAKALQQIFRDLKVSNADMERGDMRLEANISVRSKGQTELPNYRVELKNINSFRFMVAAIKYEVERQIKALKAGEKLKQETRGWNESKQETFLQRSKEEANDYRYFPEPDLPEMEIDRDYVEGIKLDLPQLSGGLVDEIVKEYSLSKHAVVVTFERLFQKGWSVDSVLELAKKSGQEVSVKQVVNLVANLPSKDLEGITSERDILTGILNKGRVVVDSDLLEKQCEEVIKENPAGAVDSYKAGREAAIGVLVGAVMRKAAGRADAGKVREILQNLLQNTD